MKLAKKILIGFLLFVGLSVALLYVFNVDYLLKAIRITYLNGHTTAFLDDYKYFDNNVISAVSNPQPWPISKQYNQLKSTSELEKTHAELGTVAFLIIKNDSILFESYYDNYDEQSKSNSFSMAKSIISAAMGKAIMQGKIKGENQLVSDYFPQFATGKSKTMTVGDLSTMSSGLNWDESYYSPFSVTTQAYFDEDLSDVILNQKAVDLPGQKFKYLSGNTQLLAMVIEKATGTDLASYVADNFWKPMGAEHDALWQTDTEHGVVKAYCCIASNARDFARFGKLYQDFGKWNGEVILDSTFVAKSIVPKFKDSPEYGYSWWLSNHMSKKIFYMRGHLGQYVIVIPEDNLIIVRLGHRAKKVKNNPHSKDFYTYINETYKMMEVAKN